MGDVAQHKAVHQTFSQKQDYSHSTRRKSHMINPQHDGNPIRSRFDCARWVALSQIAGISSRTLDQLIAHAGSLAAVFETPAAVLREVPRVGPKTVSAIQQADLDALLTAIESWQQAGVEILLREDTAYPRSLAGLENAPAVLFWAGEPWAASRPAIAVAGTRQPSPASRALAGEIAHTLAREGYTVISGLATGIDTAAHTGAIEEAGQTFAVLGSGVLSIYPPQNAPLAEAIRQQGALLSEVRPDSPPSTHALVSRNRLISGLAEAIVVVETGVTGGSMHTVRFAQAQNRRVFVVDNGASGNQHLLEQGAIALPAQGSQSALLKMLRYE